MTCCSAGHSGLCWKQGGSALPHDRRLFSGAGQDSGHDRPRRDDRDGDAAHLQSRMFCCLSQRCRDKASQNAFLDQRSRNSDFTGTILSSVCEPQHHRGVQCRTLLVATRSKTESNECSGVTFRRAETSDPCIAFRSVAGAKCVKFMYAPSALSWFPPPTSSAIHAEWPVCSNHLLFV